MLEQFLVSQVFAFILIFCRIGAGIMILPAFGETYVPPQLRLAFTFMLTLLLMPLLAKLIPPFPPSALSLALLISSEILIGLFIGALCNIMMSATHTAGMVFSFQSGMSSATVYDVTQSTQGSLIGNFMGLLALVLIFTTDLHHLLLRGVTDSYAVFTPGQWPPLHDFVETATHTLSETFLIAAQISTPLIVVGTLLFLGAGILGRLMPTMQIFYVITAPQLIVMFFIFITTFSGIMLCYLDFFREKLTLIFSYVR